MKKVVAIISPERLELVKGLLARVGIDGMTVSEVQGYGRQRSHTEQYRGAEHVVASLPKLKLEIVVNDGRVPPLVHELIRATRTGKSGDGKIFVVPILDAIRIRTDERGSDAL